MTIRNVKELVDAELDGRVRHYHWVKTVSQTTTTGVWFDLSGSSGNPRAKQWFDAAPLTAQQIRQSTDGGIFHGSSVSSDGSKKFIRHFGAYCPTAAAHPITLKLCDYLLYYPTCEDGTTDPQVMDNTNTLPRYTDGDGVQIMAVTISSRTGGQSFSVSYTNQDGVAGRTSGTVLQNASAAPGTITTAVGATASNTGGNPFIPLQDNDTGVRSIESVTMNAPDVGFFALVLVRPLLDLPLRSFEAPYEKDLLVMAQELPEVQDDAFLSCLVNANNALTGVSIRGNLKVIWG